MEEQRRSGERLRRLLSELGSAIGGSVSGSADVNDRIQRIRQQGYHIYVVLDTRIGIDRDRRRAYEAARRRPSDGNGSDPSARHVLYSPEERAEFTLNRGDVLFLQSLGIDGTRRIRPRKRDFPDLLAD